MPSEEEVAKSLVWEGQNWIDCIVLLCGAKQLVKGIVPDNEDFLSRSANFIDLH